MTGGGYSFHPSPSWVNDYMWMESKEVAFDVIASLIFYQDSIETQDRWLQACKKLGYLGDLAETMDELEEELRSDEE